jgi:hypothetical protein
MTRRPRLDIRAGESGRDRKSLLIALAFHVVILVMISGMVVVPVLDFMRSRGDDTQAAERVTFVAPPPPVRIAPPRDTLRRIVPDTATKSAAAAPAAPVIAPPATALPVTPPTEIPVGIQPPGSTAAGGDTADRRIVGRGGIPGLSPGVKDPRLLPLLPGRGVLAGGPMTSEYRGADSIVHAWVQTYWDSLAKAQMYAGRNPTDWTFDRNGKKYGIDPQWMYFGKFKLPTMLLALLPINVQANPTVFERNRALQTMRFEINYQAARATSQEGFYEAVKELRARKEAEQKAAEAKKKGGG